MNILFLAISIFLQTTIYSYNVTDVNGNNVSMAAFQGKKILLVNIATGSERVSQIAQLQDLHEQYHDRLVIIAFPSSSFGHETRSNSEIKQFCTDTYHTGFIIAQRNNVAGIGIQPVYSWLASGSDNGTTAIPILNDFQKVLLDKDGDIIGVFAPMINPTDSLIVNAITAN